MYSFVKKNNLKILVSLMSVMILFFGLTFFAVKKDNNLTEHERRIAQYDQYQDGDELIDGTDYVTFDAYFHEKIGGVATKVRGEYLNVNNQGELWLDLRVFGGSTLKDAQIELVNSNVKTSGYLYRNSFIPYNSSVPNGGIITLNPSVSGATLNNKITISENVTNDLSSFSNENKVILTGIVVKPNGEEVSIRKEVKYNIDWYFDDLTTNIGAGSGSQNFPYKVVYDCKENNGVWKYHHEYTGENYNISYSITSYANNPFIKSANFEAIIPDLNGYDPVNVTVSSQDVTYNYDPATQVLTATKEATLNGTLFTKKAYSYASGGVYYNDWNITIEYPKEVENESQVIPISTSVYYELYQNSTNGNIEVITAEPKSHVFSYSFTKPVIRTTIGSCGSVPMDRLEFLYNATTGNYSNLLRVRYVNKTAATKLYSNDNDADKTTEYPVTWDINLSYFDKFEEDSIKSVIISDGQADKAVRSTLNNISTYKSLKFNGAENYLGTNGYIKIINNDNDEVIAILTALNWNDVYTFTTNVSSIRLETSEIVDKNRMRDHYTAHGWQDSITLDLFYVSIVKSIDNQKLKDTYSLDEFNAFNYISSTVKVNAVRYRADRDTEETTTSSRLFEGTASYRNLQSAGITLAVNPTTINTTITNPATITINTGEFHDIVEGYKNAEFLVVFPDSILDFDINQVSVETSSGSTKIEAYEKVEIDGKKCIRIITSNDYPSKYKITIKADLMPDSRLMSLNSNIRAYAYNPGTDLSSSTAQDIYDVDNDGNTTEYQNFASASIQLSAPNEVITTTTINYKDLDDNTTTVISPMTADVNPLEDKSDAEIEIGITNNAFYPTKDFKIIGKIGFVGNTYQIGEGDLGSEFDVKIANGGIQVPDEIASNTRIYYSTNPAPDDDINKASNGWVKSTDLQSFDNIKTYMIIIDDYTLPVGRKMTFKYDIDMPNNTANLNKKTYFTHGVYYNIATDAGDLSSFVGGAKLGINVARKYDLNLTNYKYATDQIIYSSQYIAVAKDDQGNIIDQKILKVNNGQASAKNLYAGYEYELTQSSVDYPYILDEEVKTFQVTNNANDELVLDTTGTYKSASLANNHLVNLTLENETRYDVVIRLTDVDDGTVIPGSAFVIEGKGYENGYASYTGGNGELYLSGLYLDEEYTIRQISSPDHLPYRYDYNDIKVYLKRDKNNNIKIAIKKKPPIEYMGDVENGFTYSVNEWDSAQINDIYRKVNDTYTTSRGYFKIDLSEFEKDYYIDLNLFKYYNNNNGTRYGYARVYVLTEDNPDATPYNYAISCGSEYCSKSDYIRKTNDASQSTITGGNIYYLYFATYNGQATLNNSFSASFRVKNDDYEDEWVALAQQTDYVVNASNRLVENLNNDDDKTPVLTIDVKNKKIPKYTLEITKKDAETGQPLAGAQYKITGGSLPESGKYITTNEDGIATIELEEGVKVEYSLLQDWSGWSLFTEDEVYEPASITVEEVVAPVGYQLDTKKVVYNAYQDHYASCDYSYNTCDLSTYRVTHYITYSTNSSNRSEAEFKSFAYDDATNTYKVSLEDSPIIRITKKDAETGELLPNTLFAVYKIESAGGIRVFSPALDANGEIVGNKINIDGTDYYVVATNSNGSFNLSLPAGQYKLQEVQAADDKYTLDNTAYYFGVGETVPYSAQGISYVGSYDMELYDIYNYHTQNTYHTTSDGGIILTSGGPYVLKYDKDFNLEWKTDVTTTAYYNMEFHTPEGVRMMYPVDGDENKLWNELDEAHQVYEAADGSGYYVNVGNYEYIYGGMFLIKLDNDGNKVWQSQKYGYYYVYDLTAICDVEPNETLSEWQKVTGDDTHKYCYPEGAVAESYNYFSSYYVNNMIATPDGGAYLLASLPNSRPDWLEGFLLYDGSKVFTRMSTDGNYYGGGLNLYLLKYDTNGHLISATEIGDQLIQAEMDTLNSLNLPDEVWANTRCLMGTWYDRDPVTHECNYGASYSGASTMEFFEDGSLLFSPNQTANANIVAKFDPNLNLVYFTIVSIDHNTRPTNFQNDYYQGQKIHPTADGGFTFQTYETRSLEWSDTEYFRYLPEFDIPFEKTGDYEYYGDETPVNYGEWILKFDANGKPEKATEFLRKNVDPTLNLLYGNNDKYRVISSNYNTSYVDVGDGYIVSDQFYPWCSSCHYPTTLKSGEVINYSDRFFYDSGNSGYNGMLIYKVDYDGGVEWIKQYYVEGWINSLWYLYQPMYLDALGRLHYPVYAYNTGTDRPFIEEITSDGSGIKLYNDSTQGTNGSMQARYYDLVFELSDEVSPSGPEAYTLSIENERKEFKITASSNVGGDIKATDPNDSQNVITTDGASVILEKVKYGDDNQFNITITPTTDYAVGSVKVNGKDATYTINDDGTVVLGKIENIREDKNIVITYVPHIYGQDGEVVVKHYKKGTTEQAFNDDSILGAVGDPYLAEPKSSDLYSIETDESGEYIFPDNMSGTIAADQTVVIFYYVENEVELKTNYYIDGTDTELAPSNVERKTLGTSYQTAPIDIDNYEYTRTVGNRSGVLNNNTEVTFMYRQATESTITIKYVDEATGNDIIEPIVKKVRIGDTYTTDDPVTIPTNYRFTSVVGAEAGQANDAEITVIYYYQVIPFNISVDKKINSVLLNGKAQNITNGKNITISPFKKDDLVVTYEIIVENTGEIKATFKVVEKEIPGFVITDKGDFTKVGNNYELNVELEPGEKKTYKITYKWNQKDYGISVNEVSLTDVTNDNGFDEPDGTDNISTAKVETTIPEDVLDDKVIIPETVDKIVISVFLLMTSLIGMITLIILTRKKRMN